VLSDPAAGMDRVAPLVSNDEARLYRLVFVPGLFAQCLDPLIRLFDDAMAHLAALDFEVHYFLVGGRATAEANAAMLAGQFTALQLDPKPTLVFAYSKAIVDLTDDPSRRDRARQLPACYVHADHLAIALPLRQQLPGWLLVYRDEVPRATLIEAAVRVVAAALAGHVARAPGVIPIRATS